MKKSAKILWSLAALTGVSVILIKSSQAKAQETNEALKLRLIQDAQEVVRAGLHLNIPLPLP